MKSIGRELHVHIEIDKKCVHDVGIAVDVPANLDATGLTARKVLDFRSFALGLTFVIEDECIIVTTPEKAESRLEIVIYDVTDLVMHQDEKGQWYEKSGPLIDAIASCVGQTTWNSVGGPGAIAPLDLPHSASLAVSQTQNIHEEIAQFLADIRRVEAARRKNRAAAAPSDAQMVGRKIIKVAGDMTAAIAAANVSLRTPIATRWCMPRTALPGISTGGWPTTHRATFSSLRRASLPCWGWPRPAPRSHRGRVCPGAGAHAGGRRAATLDVGRGPRSARLRLADDHASRQAAGEWLRPADGQSSLGANRRLDL